MQDWHYSLPMPPRQFVGNSSTRQWQSLSLVLCSIPWIIHSACLGETTAEKEFAGVSFPAVSISGPFFPRFGSEVGHQQQRDGSSEAIDFLAKALWIIETRGGQASSRFTVESNDQVYTNRRWVGWRGSIHEQEIQTPSPHGQVSLLEATHLITAASFTICGTINCKPLQTT